MPCLFYVLENSLDSMATSEVAVQPNRLGQSAIALHTDQSSFIPVISEIPYTQRILKRPWVSYMGARPIHRTTLNLDRSKPKLDYLTIYKHVSSLYRYQKLVNFLLVIIFDFLLHHRALLLVVVACFIFVAFVSFNFVKFEDRCYMLWLLSSIGLLLVIFKFAMNFGTM